MSSAIEDYALLGNCRSAALLGRDGSIDWLCFPRFDSSACFAALLGTRENGRWRIAPRDPEVKAQRAYQQGSLILETLYTSSSGSARVLDFMPLGGRHDAVVRLVTGVQGRLRFDMDLAIRFDYGNAVPWVERLDEQTLSAVAGPDMLVLHSNAPMHGRDLHTESSFEVGAGERYFFVLRYQYSNSPLPPPLDVDAACAATRAFWHEFSARCPDVGSYTDQVQRSLITLKALTYQPTGGIVAAVTTSLPEWPGGARNWDYRYCWLRDAAMSLQAFVTLGYQDEARAWYDWLMRAIAGNPEQMQIMYGLAGERRLTERELPWLAGYQDSCPVRVGNAAAVQFQLDIYGEVADAITAARKAGLPSHRRSQAIADVVLPYLERAWRETDEGIWEVRGPRRHFTHSKVMAWLAFQRVAERAELVPGRAAFAAHCREVAQEIHEEICNKAWDEEMGSFVQYYGAKTLDASLLHMALSGFLPATDPRILGTVDAIEKRLLQDGLLRRYDTEEVIDGLPPGEGVFLACSFWLADVYVMLGRLEDARKLYERLLALSNDVGLLSEQYDTRGQRMLGNFPQAFSHIGVITTAVKLHKSGGQNAGLEKRRHSP